MHVMVESNVPITRVSNIKMLVAFARKGNKLKQTNSKKTTTKNRQAKAEETERERGREGREGRGGKPLQIATSTQSQSKLFSKLIFMSCQK